MPNKKEQRLETERLLETVGLKGSYADIYPWQVSAGSIYKKADRLFIDSIKDRRNLTHVDTGTDQSGLDGTV